MQLNENIPSYNDQVDGSTINPYDLGISRRRRKKKKPVAPRGWAEEIHSSHDHSLSSFHLSFYQRSW